MSWTTTNKTWSVGEVVTAAMLNTYVRDQFIETAPAKVTTAGDIVYATAANTLARLGIGSTGQILAVQGTGVPAWFTPPYCRAYHSATQTLGNGATTVLAFDTEAFDTSGMHSTVSNSSRFTPTVRGVYLASFNATLDGNSSGVRYLDVNIDGALYQRDGNNAAAAAGTHYQSMLSVSALSTTSYFTFGIFQNTGGNLGLTANGGVAWIQWVAPV